MNIMGDIREVMNRAEMEARLQEVDLKLPPPEGEPDRQYYFIRRLQEWARKKMEALGRPLTANITTFGCPFV